MLGNCVVVQVGDLEHSDSVGCQYVAGEDDWVEYPSHIIFNAGDRALSHEGLLKVFPWGGFFLVDKVCFCGFRACFAFLWAQSAAFDRRLLDFCLLLFTQFPGPRGQIQIALQEEHAFKPIIEMRGFFNDGLRWGDWVGAVDAADLAFFGFLRKELLSEQLLKASESLDLFDLLRIGILSLFLDVFGVALAGQHHGVSVRWESLHCFLMFSECSHEVP